MIVAELHCSRRLADAFCGRRTVADGFARYNSARQEFLASQPDTSPFIAVHGHGETARFWPVDPDLAAELKLRRR